MNPSSPPQSRFKRRAVDPADGLQAPRTALLPEGVPWPAMRVPASGQPSTAQDLAAWLQAERSAVRTRLESEGALLFRGYGVHSAEALALCMEALQAPALAYNERSSPRTAIARGVYTSTEHPHHQRIPLHNENAYQDTWPGLLALCCEVAPDVGGQTPIADCRRIHARVPEVVLQAFRARGIEYRRHFDGHLGLRWQQVFNTESREEVEAYCGAHGLTATWVGSAGLSLHARRPLVEHHVRTQEAIWFNHAVFFNASTLEAELQAALASVPRALWPFDTAYGDGTPIEPSTIALLRHAYEEEAVQFSWQRGDLLLLDNMLTCHGRAPYAGPRRILVSMAEPISLRDLDRPATPPPEAPVPR